MIFWLNLLLLGFSAGLLTWATQVQLNSTTAGHIYDVIAFNCASTICIYATMRSRLLYVHPNEQPVAINKLLALAVIGVSGLTAAYFLFRLPVNKLIIAAPLIVLSLAYFLPLIPTQKRFLRLRDIMPIKHPAVGLAWGLATVLLPAADYNSIALWMLMSERICFIAALSLLFDHRDIHTDHAVQHNTIVGSKGWNFSSRLSMLLMLIAALFVPGSTNDAALMIKKLLVMGLSVLLIQQTNTSKKDWWYNILLESLIPLYALAALL